MAITDESRYQLFQGLTQALGPERAATLMELLPPVGWADVATKRDLDHLETVLRTEFRSEISRLDSKIEVFSSDLRRDMASLETSFYRGQRSQLATIVAANTAITALLLTAFRFA